MYFSFVNILIWFALACTLVQAQAGWGLQSGQATLGFLNIPSTPRAASLSGSGLADPGLASEAAWNPMAGAFATGSSVSGSQARLSERLGVNWNSLQMVQPISAVRLLAGLNFLDVKNLQGADEWGNQTGEYGAFAWSGRLGLASDSGAFTWGFQGMFNHYNIDAFNSRSMLGDVVLGYGVGRNLRFAAGAFHWGWVESFDTEQEYAPSYLQAGLSYKLPFGSFLQWELHGDLRRQTDGPREILLGVESFYGKVLVLRMGLDATADELAPSGGVGLNLGPVEASYGYSANKALQGNHHFGLGYQF